MLDVQRNRGAKNRGEIEFTRKIMWTHMIWGAAVIALFLFHELFIWFAGSLVWYAASLAAMYGFMNQSRCCRWLLSLVFLAGTAVGLLFLNRIYPDIIPSRTALLPHSAIPLWLGFSNLTYGLGALVVLFNSRVRIAGETGFMLW
ncbi:hypothetical protein [Prosthecobacter sp.]|uniref:hypothetical protein n=1 Tax=Prosthecobacter sp. TaxID=1965333 RepID=UPI003783EC1F